MALARAMELHQQPPERVSREVMAEVGVEGGHMAVR